MDPIGDLGIVRVTVTRLPGSRYPHFSHHSPLPNLRVFEPDPSGRLWNEVGEWGLEPTLEVYPSSSVMWGGKRITNWGTLTLVTLQEGSQGGGRIVSQGFKGRIKPVSPLSGFDWGRNNRGIRYHPTGPKVK